MNPPHSEEIGEIDKYGWVKYFINGVLCWVIVDFTTVFNPDFQRWFQYWPAIWLFYTLFPLLFSFLIYRIQINDKQLFLFTIIEIFVSEVILSQNLLLFSFPIMVIAIPLALCIYVLITFLPKWIVEKKMDKNRKKIIFLIIIWLIVSLLTFSTNSN